jgi:hypothetical protein
VLPQVAASAEAGLTNLAHFHIGQLGFGWASSGKVCRLVELSLNLAHPALPFLHNFCMPAFGNFPGGLTTKSAHSSQIQVHDTSAGIMSGCISIFGKPHT